MTTVVRGGVRTGDTQERAPGIRDLVVVAHRGPVRFRQRAQRLIAERNAGGLVTALRHLGRHAPEMRWICAPATEVDRELARRAPWLPVGRDPDSILVQMLDLDPEVHRRFYARIANPLLWNLQHSLGDHAFAPSFGPEDHAAWSDGYVAVNRSFARALADPDEIRRGSTVMLHDYHCYLVPSFVRPGRPDLFLHFFVHIPWPQPDSWRVLPEAWRDAVFRGLLGSDIVAFHTERYARAFLAGCSELLGASVDWAERAVIVRDRGDDRLVRVRHYPISVDAGAVDDLAQSAECEREREQFRYMRARGSLIVRVDRADPSKNIVRGFHAYDRLLTRYPELACRVTFAALVQPSRQEVGGYDEYLAAIRSAVDAVNRRHRRGDWLPVELVVGDNIARAFAAYREFDVLMVNSVADGMNLVAKEGILVNRRNGVVALSETAGAHEELGAVALTLHPFDIEQQAETLHRALTMPAIERQRRWDVAATIVRTNDVHKWMQRQLADIAALRDRS